MCYTILLQRLFIAIAIVLSSACTIQPTVLPNDPHYAPVVTPTTPKPRLQEGSLYHEEYGLALFGNGNSHKLGDIITILLDERTVASKSNSVSIEKENTIDSSNGSILGNTPGFKGLNLLTDVDQEREFTGEADADQSNRLQGNISVTVTDIMPNGNLVVRGEKWLTLSRGDEYIRISGMVRAGDISLQNTVSSTKLANARITYSGTGELADAQKMGWLSRFFNSVYWPF